jgi:DnaK suppressor protein
MKKPAGKKTSTRSATRAATKVRPKVASKVAPKVAPAPRAPKAGPKPAARPAPKAPPPKAKAQRAPAAPAPRRVARPPRDAAWRRRMARFREVLVGRHQALQEAYRTGKGSTRETTSDGTEDYIDYAVSSYDRDFMLSLTEMEQRQMVLIEEALRRLDRGEFGRCQQCGQDIPEKRLEVEPWARHCVRCQELEEQGLLLLQQPGGLDGEFDEEPRSEEAPEVEDGVEAEEEVSDDPGGVEIEHDDDDDGSG